MSLNSADIMDIIIMRGLGLHQDEVADRIGVSTKTIENYLKKLREEALKTENKNELYYLFWNKILGHNMISLISFMVNNANKNK